MSQWGIGLRRLSSEGGHYFRANYLGPHVNKQPARVKNTLCSRLQNLGLSLLLPCLMLALTWLLASVFESQKKRTSMINCELKSSEPSPSSCVLLKSPK